jgi:hypothetical protein
MKVIEKGLTPKNIAIQLEDWSEDYDSPWAQFCVVAYPISKINFGSYTHRGEKFRLDINVKDKEEAFEIYDNLKNGEKVFKDYREKFHFGVTDEMKLGIYERNKVQ